MSTIQPVSVVADQDVLLGFSTKLFGAEEILRAPAEGMAFYLGLRIGDTDLGLVATGGQYRRPPSGPPGAHRVELIEWAPLSKPPPT